MGDFWGAFLCARATAIRGFAGEGKTADEIAVALSCDADQVRAIMALSGPGSVVQRFDQKTEVGRTLAEINRALHGSGLGSVHSIADAPAAVRALGARVTAIVHVARVALHRDFYEAKRAGDEQGALAARDALEAIESELKTVRR